MGKTTFCGAGVDEAGRLGLLVLRAQPAESETALSFSGLGDLLDPVLDEALAPLAAGQRSAPGCALVLEDVEGPPPDARAAGVALLNALRGLAGARGVLVAIDDVPDVDRRSVVGCARLCDAAPRVRERRTLLARRAGIESALVEELRHSRSAERFVDLEVVRSTPPRSTSSYMRISASRCLARSWLRYSTPPAAIRLRARDRAQLSRSGVSVARAAAPGTRLAARARPRSAAGATGGNARLLSGRGGARASDDPDHGAGVRRRPGRGANAGARGTRRRGGRRSHPVHTPASRRRCAGDRRPDASRCDPCPSRRAARRSGSSRVAARSVR